MLVNLQTILKKAKENKYCVPAFNVYNMETVMGVIQAAEEANSPVIMQVYSRLTTSGNFEYLAPIMIHAAHIAKVPVCIHLDHGAGFIPAAIALKNGCSGIMVDFSLDSLEENIEKTKKVVDIMNEVNVGVEGELGHIGKTSEDISANFTEVKDAIKYVKETGVTALAIMVGTAHGRYKQTPVLGIERIKEIADSVPAYLVLHGGSGVPEDQIKKAIAAGICKMNFSTDLCYSFIESVQKQDKTKVAIDLIMKEPVEAVKNFALSKIDVLGSRNKA